MKINNTSVVTIHDHDGRVTRHEPTLWVPDHGPELVHFDLDDHEGAVVVRIQGDTYRKSWTHFLRDHICDAILSAYIMSK